MSNEINNTQPQSRLLKIEEAAHRTSTHKNYIWSLIKSGKLPAVRIGERIVRIYESDLLNLFREYKVTNE